MIVIIRRETKNRRLYLAYCTGTVDFNTWSKCRIGIMNQYLCRKMAKEKYLQSNRMHGFLL
jgi:hypothetical protein